MPSIFSNIKNVKGSRDANYVKPGNGLFKIDRVKMDKSRKGDEFIAIEMTCLATTERFYSHPTTGAAITETEHLQFPADKRGKLLSHSSGESVTHLLMLKQDLALPNFKSFIKAASGIPEEQITEEVCLAAVGEAQTLSCLVLEINARETLTQKNKPYTRVNYLGRATKDQFLRATGKPAPEDLFFEDDFDAAAAAARNAAANPSTKA